MMMTSSSASLNILIAEDSRMLARPVIYYLEQAGHRVTHVSNGREAVQQFRLNPPDVVLMDVVMPDMDGIEATRLIKSIRTRRWVPIIMMTSLDSDQDFIRGLEAGADDYMFKPFRFEVLEARIRSMQRIAQIQNTLSDIVDNVVEGIVTIDGRGIIQSFNKAAETIFGYAAQEAMGHNISLVMPQPDADLHDGYIARYLADTAHPRIVGIHRQVEGRRKNGEIFPMTLGVSHLAGVDGDLFIGLIRDITEELAAQKKIEFMALHDALTGLPNRAQFTRRLDQAIQTPPQEAGDVALLFLDIDGFKPINDTYGHDIGDLVLKEIAKRLEYHLHELGFAARLGGDEFVVVLPSVKKELATFVADKLVQVIREPMNFDGLTCKVGVSIGLALAENHPRSSDALLCAADNAMYAAKKGGKNRYVLACAEEFAE